MLQRMGGLLRVLVLAPILACGAAPAMATHFKYGHFDWESVTTVTIPELKHTPDAISGTGPQYFDVSGTISGSSVQFGKLTFQASGGFTLEGPSGFKLTRLAPSFYAGTDAAPIFAAKKGDLINPLTGQKSGRFYFAAVPEPQSWAMLIAGFGAIGVAARRQRRRLAA